MTNKNSKTKIEEETPIDKNHGESSSEDFGAQLFAAEEEAKSHYDKLLRVMAEFENFKKRMSKESDEQLKYANEKLLKELLPTLDDLDRVLDHIPPDASPESKKISEGVEIVRKSFLGVLEKFGLREVDAYDQIFDPIKHEAIATIESDAHAPGHIASVHRKGYWLQDRLLRPAMVTVVKSSEL